MWDKSPCRYFPLKTYHNRPGCCRGDTLPRFKKFNQILQLTSRGLIWKSGYKTILTPFKLNRSKIIIGRISFIPKNSVDACISNPEYYRAISCPSMTSEE